MQAQKNYVLKVQQAKADVRESFLDLQKQREKVEEMEEVLRPVYNCCTCPWNGYL